MKLLVSLEGKKLPKSIGNKAKNLHRLSHLALPTPKTFVIPWKAYQRYLADDDTLIRDLQSELSYYLDSNKKYAVRSSANIEDGLEKSFAGHFQSVLNVQGIDSIIQAIWSIFDSVKSPQVQSYLDNHNLFVPTMNMAVILQEMVTPAWSGVAFSRNPVTGADEVVVEAVEGLGEALVQGGITPDRWINKWGTYITKPDKESVPNTLIDQIVAQTRSIGGKLNSHVDLEWVFNGEDLCWVQVREITTLNRHNVYSNHISKEVIPGIIKPLIGSINIPLVCSQWVRLVNEMVGKTSVKPEDLAKSFYYRVYFNMGTLGQIFQEIGMPYDSVETLMGVIPPGSNKPGMKPTMKTFLRFPSLLRFFIEKWFFAPTMRRVIKKLNKQFASFDYNNVKNLESSELIEQIDHLYRVVRNAAYYNIIGPLLMMMHNQMLKRQLNSVGVDFSQFELMGGITEQKDYEPNTHIHLLHEKFRALPFENQEAIKKSNYDEFLKLGEIKDFQRDVRNFIDRFGHFSDHGNDFSEIPWRETPDLVLDLIKNFTVPGKDKNKKIKIEELPFRGLKRLMFKFFYRRARDYNLLREKISSSYTFGYGLFRYYYLELGKRFEKMGLLDNSNDIFYFEDSEVLKLVKYGNYEFNTREIVSKRKQDIKRFENINLPSVIYGDEQPPIEDQFQEKLIGVPTSIGQHTGKVKVVRGLKDFNKVERGDVLAIPFSDVGWTPLFARAGAVIAESGGLLSHSSIVAREYNIPAIVSVAGATKLQDHTVVTVNGQNGEVLIHKD